MRPIARFTVFLLSLALLVTAVAATAAPSVLLRKPNGQQVVLPLTANPIEVDARTGEIIATPAAKSGVVGDGWCPDQMTSAPVFSWPALSLRLSNGQLYRIPLASGTSPSWGALTTVWQVHTKASQGVPGDGWCPPIAAAPQFTVPLIAQPTSVVAGNETTLRWTSVGANTCSTSGSVYPQGVTQVDGWGPAMPTENGGTRLRPLTAGAYRFRLTCQKRQRRDLVRSIGNRLGNRPRWLMHGRPCPTGRPQSTIKLRAR
ncbi:MAG: hypothetical protein IPK97_08390 [Ahniella sp.]|nr:hypothetical protein [Ahniella sp.]